MIIDGESGKVECKDESVNERIQKSINRMKEAMTPIDLEKELNELN